MLESVLESCHLDLKLCIASDITLSTESIITKAISEWRKDIPQLKDKMVIFIF
jgi:16S rRNA (cytidine1402-2'-O)-methyltransferase